MQFDKKFARNCHYSVKQWLTVSARIEPHSWLDPHPKKNLIDPQSKTDIETIEPHLELTPTQLVFIWGGTRSRPGLDSKWEKPAMHMQQSTSNNAHACWCWWYFIFMESKWTRAKLDLINRTPSWLQPQAGQISIEPHPKTRLGK